MKEKHTGLRGACGVDPQSKRRYRHTMGRKGIKRRKPTRRPPRRKTDRPAPLDPTGLEGTAAGRYDGSLAAGYFLRDLARLARGHLSRPSRAALWAIPLAVAFSLLLMLVWLVVLALTSNS